MSEQHHEEDYEDDDVVNQDVNAVDESDDIERADDGSNDEPIDDTATRMPDDDDVADWGFGEKKSRFGKEVVIAFGAIAVLLGMFGWVVHNQMSETKDGGAVAGDVPEGTLGPEGSAGDDPFMTTSLGAAQNGAEPDAPNGDEQFLPPTQNEEPDEHHLAMQPDEGNFEPTGTFEPTGNVEPSAAGDLLGGNEPLGSNEPFGDQQPLMAGRDRPAGLFDGPSTTPRDSFGDTPVAVADPDFGPAPALGQTEPGGIATSVASRDRVSGPPSRLNSFNEAATRSGRIPTGAIGGLDDNAGTLSTEDRAFGLFGGATGDATSTDALAQNEPLAGTDPPLGLMPADSLPADPFAPASEPLGNVGLAQGAGSDLTDPFAPVVEPDPLLANKPLPVANSQTLPVMEGNSLLTDQPLDLGNSEPLVGSQLDSPFEPGGEALSDLDDPLISVREPSGASSLPDASPAGLLDASPAGLLDASHAGLLDEPAMRTPQPVTLGDPGISDPGLLNEPDPFAPVTTPIDRTVTTFENDPFESVPAQPTNSGPGARAGGKPLRDPAATLLSPTVESGPSTVISDAATRSPSSATYVIQSGDSFWSISKKVYGQGRYFRDLAQFNRALVPDPEKLKVGTEIQTPDLSTLRPTTVSAVTPEPAMALAQPTISPVASTLEGSVTARRAVIDASDKPSGIYTSTQGYPMYRVGPDDNLTSISAEHLGRASRWKQVFAMNRDILQSPSDLQVGMVLKLPADASKIPLTERTSSLR